MSQLKIIAPDLQEGVDRKLLKQLRARFLEVNSGRLDRMLSTLSSRHRQFLESLPLLLHLNHPSLPGYISSTTPCGVSGFTPDKNSIMAAQSISRSFSYRKKSVQKDKIFSIFLMGSTGTVAHSDSSDMDIWVCYDPTTSQQGIDELQDKLTDIEQWAEQIGLEVHFFLMNPIKFRNGVRSNLSGEDCGSTQHYLLLDEFYRTSIIISGRTPLWWMIPSYNEKDYDKFAAHLIEKRFIRTEECVDFGGISDFPAGEFIGAGLWQLYKGIDSPYKSVIKIVLTEVYASEHPEVECLSLAYKKAIYSDQLNLDELDPYVMLYRKIEHYLLARQEHQRLELIRHCFYFKVQENLSRTTKQKSGNWRRQLMSHLVREWGWQEKYLRELDNRKQWKIQRVGLERQELVRELNHSYRFLSSFARENNIAASISQDDLNVLGRKLYAAFERKGGKIDLLNPGITTSLVEFNLSFHHIVDKEHRINHRWVAYQGYLKPKDISEQTPIKTTRSIIELLAWCYFNQIIDQNTRLSVEAEGTDMSENELNQTAQSLLAIFPNRTFSPPQKNFETPPIPSHITLFINAGIDPMRPMTQKGIHRLSDQSDALSYSAFHHNLVSTVDQIMVNSWGEIICQQYFGDNALIDCLVNYMRQIPPDGTIPLPKLEIRCHCATRAISIENRVTELFRDIISCYYSGMAQPNIRYILEVEQFTYILQFKGETPVVRGMRTHRELIETLSEPLRAFSPILVDRNALLKHPLRIVSKMNTANRIQVFYQRNGDKADIIVADEMGSIFFTQKNFFNENTVLNPIRHFLENIQRRKYTLSATEQGHKVVYYEIGRLQQGDMVAHRKHFTPLQQMDNYHNVQAIAQTGSLGDIFYTIYCDNKEFSQLEYGDALFAAVAAHIASLRRNNEHYPCYITDLDLSQLTLAENEALQTIQYLQHKEKLEIAINQALKES